MAVQPADTRGVDISVVRGFAGEIAQLGVDVGNSRSLAAAGRAGSSPGVPQASAACTAFGNGLGVVLGELAAGLSEDARQVAEILDRYVRDDQAFSGAAVQLGERLQHTGVVGDILGIGD